MATKAKKGGDLTVSEAADYLGLPESTVYKLVKNRKLGSCRHATGSGRGTIRIPAAEAERYRLSCFTPAASEAEPAARPKGKASPAAKAPLAICGPESWGDGD